MWDNLLRVDWGRLAHAYGRANDAPRILLNMASADEKAREAGWNSFWGSLNHQGDFYDSTVASIPFLIEAASRPGAPGRARILDYFRDRWLDAPEYGGDPALAEPPGGIDEPTPMRTTAEFAEAARQPLVEPDDGGADEDFDTDSYRRMDLCAWQAGRAIEAGRSAFEGLLGDHDLEVAAAAAELLLHWPETRAGGKRALIRAIEEEPNPVDQARRILEFGVYTAEGDEAAYEAWTAPQRPAVVRAAAALAWAWAADPGPLPGPAAIALEDTSEADSDAFAKLPWAGVWHRGPWILPPNASWLILRLARHRDDEVRWRAVQGLAAGREGAKHIAASRAVDLLIERLSDPSGKIRTAAALALSQRGEIIFEINPGIIPALMRALDDVEPSACGHAARLLAAVPHRLIPIQRARAAERIGRAADRFAGQESCYVMFDSMGIQAAPFLEKQRDRILEPPTWDIPALFEEIAFPHRQDKPISLAECDRRLADAFDRDSPAAIAAAIAALGDPVGRRSAAIGAARWLSALGPAAEPALPALDALASMPTADDPQLQAKAAATFIRRSLLADVEPNPSAGAPTRSISTSKLIESLGYPAASARVRAAELLAERWPDEAAAIPALEALLDDEAAIEVGIAGRFESEGRLHHWRLERRSPRASAIQALFRIGRVPEGDRMLRAMIAESECATVICNDHGEPRRFEIAQWRAAAEAVGNAAAAIAAIRAARQQLRARAWSGDDPDNSAFASEAALADVIRRLSGRLV